MPPKLFRFGLLLALLRLSLFPFSSRDLRLLLGLTPVSSHRSSGGRGASTVGLTRWTRLTHNNLCWRPERVDCSSLTSCCCNGVRKIHFLTLKCWLSRGEKKRHTPSYLPQKFHLGADAKHGVFGWAQFMVQHLHLLANSCNQLFRYNRTGVIFIVLYFSLAWMKWM